MEMVGKETKINFKSIGRQKPAPDEVLEFVICNCKKSRSETNKCLCFSLNMKCTDLCKCKSCSNVYTDEDVKTTEEDDENENFDDDNWDDMLEDEEDLLDNMISNSNSTQIKFCSALWRFWFSINSQSHQ